MKLLAIDTCTENCSAALWLNGELLSQAEESPKVHTKRLLPMVDELLAQTQLSLRQLDGIVVGRGPGSFTGVRIGIAVAQGLAFSADLPLAGASTLQALAQQVYRLTQAEKVCCAIDARMNEVYVAHFSLQQQLMVAQSDELLLPPSDLDVSWLNGARAAGSGWQAYPALEQLLAGQEIGARLPLAQDMLPWALAHWQQVAQAPELVEPLYLRDKVAQTLQERGLA